ncbi:MAG: endonuclease MutS2 [Lachnospiraceae bacterium]|nr:endonuclease MutS2 [Lachnospiraceae bacterium]
MNSKAPQVLEFHKILQMLSEKASSAAGKDMCLKLLPSGKPEVIETMQQETADALARLLKNSAVSFSGCLDIKDCLAALKIERSLNAGELLRIAKLLENTNRIKAYGRSKETMEQPDTLSPYFDSLEPLTELAKELNRCIISEDEISDEASSTLKHIRRQIRLTGDKIHSDLTHMVNNKYKNVLQDNVITMRDGRYCIPVKAEYKSSVPGMVHDQSASASTWFIEPAAIVELNNKLRELVGQEQAEIERILMELSASCGAHLQELTTDSRTLTRLDFIFAKGFLALEQNATKPLYNEEGIISLRKARHPLLPKDTVVPTDIRIGRDFKMLIITGPNTGGKTVTLKTVGLLSLMGQAGLHIPTLDRSELSVFQEIYADIGDEQSIEQSLSTFSSHMKKIVEILKKADQSSLCLFDELGAGTDPTEGAALAIAILDELRKRQATTVATTHYSELKVYALRKKGVENASCEFDIETLSPTYRLLIGVPGKSNAFAISKKLGLKDYIIENAKKQIDKTDESLEDVLSKLEDERVTLENVRSEIDREKAELSRLKEEYETRSKKLADSRDKLLRASREEAEDILREAKETADEAILAFQKSGNIQDMEKMRDKLRQSLSRLRQGNADAIAVPKDTEDKKKLKAADLKPGTDVKIISMNLEGRVISPPDQKGKLFVQCGIMKIEATLPDIELIETKETQKLRREAGAHYGLSKASTISPELNLIGKTTDEALYELEKYLDDAYLSHLSSVRIVHGKGTGALRNTVWKQLKRLKYVSAFRLAEYGEGDAGVTIVTFK